MLIPAEGQLDSITFHIDTMKKMIETAIVKLNSVRPKPRRVRYTGLSPPPMKPPNDDPRTSNMIITINAIARMICAMLT